MQHEIKTEMNVAFHSDHMERKVNYMNTTDLFNYFHDELKDVIEDMHWSKKFRKISGVSKEETDACYYRNKEIKNDEVANQKLIAYIHSLGYKIGE